ncbi:MAG: hypothetical protein H8E37_08275 [Planctomycetes bacterium]|nr:hypothetical protein [Planctomycetota bacterium]
MFSRRNILIGISAVSLIGAVSGYVISEWTAGDADAVSLTEDEVLRRERAAIERLKERGCHAELRTDEWIGVAGVLLTLFPEHIDEKGHIVKEVFADLRYLRNCFLVLDQTPISNEGLVDLKTLDNLLLLSLQQTPVTDDGMGHVEGIISLRLLRLNWTAITDHGLRHIDRLPDLVMLYLSGTRVTDNAMLHIVELKKLAALQLSFTKVSDKACAALPKLPELQFLGLDRTDVTDVGVTHLRSCKKLGYVNLTQTALTDKRLIELRSEIPNCRVVRKVTLRHLHSASGKSKPREPPKIRVKFATPEESSSKPKAASKPTAPVNPITPSAGK